MPTARHMTIQERPQHDKLCSICFQYPYEERKDPYQGEEREIPYGAFAPDGTLLAGLCANVFTCSFGGERVKLAGIGAVVSDPAHRRNGAVRSIFETMLPELYDLGFVFSALYPFSHVFYRKFGYELCLPRPGVRIPTRDLRADKRDCTIKLMQKGDDVGKLLSIYEEYQSTKDFAITRNLKFYERQLERDALTKLHNVYLWERGQARGYVIGDIRKDGDHRFSIEDMAYNSREALEGLLGFLKGFNEFEKIELYTHDDMDWPMLIDEPYNIEMRFEARGMLRVVNVEKALSLLTPLPFDGRMVLEISDAQIAQNSGRYLVRSESGKISVSRTQDAPDLSLTIPVLSQLISGMTDYPAFLLCAQGVTKHSENAAIPYFFPRRQRHMNNYF